MSEYLEKREDENCFYVAQWFGYALSSNGRKCVKNKNATLLKTQEATISDRKSIYDILLNSMCFSSHYIEDSKFYIDYVDYSQKHYDKLTKEQKENYNQELEDEVRFDLFKSYLDGSSIETTSSIYRIPYTLDGKQLGHRIETKKWVVYEDGSKKEFPMMTKELVCFVEDNGDYIHIEPELMTHTLKMPRLEKEVSNHKEDSGFNIKNIHERIIKDAIEFGILSPQ